MYTLLRHHSSIWSTVNIHMAPFLYPGHYTHTHGTITLSRPEETLSWHHFSTRGTVYTIMAPFLYQRHCIHFHGTIPPPEALYTFSWDHSFTGSTVHILMAPFLYSRLLIFSHGTFSSLAISTSCFTVYRNTHTIFLLQYRQHYLQESLLCSFVRVVKVCYK